MYKNIKSFQFEILWKCVWIYSYIFQQVSKLSVIQLLRTGFVKRSDNLAFIFNSLSLPPTIIYERE